MITEDQWLNAQVVESHFWADSGSNSSKLMFELVEHSEVCTELRRILTGRKKLKALEVGVGPIGIGFLSAHVNNYISEIIGIEPLPFQEISVEDKALELYAKTLQKRVKYICGKGESIGYEDETFDLACCINVIDHSHNPELILLEISRVLKKNGIFVLGVNTFSYFGRIKWKTSRFFDKQNNRYIAHPHTYTWTELNKKFEKIPWKNVLWTNKQSFGKRIMGHGKMSFWITIKG